MASLDSEFKNKASLEAASDSDDDQPTAVAAGSSSANAGDIGILGGDHLSRSEKKARKSLAKLGLKKVEGITRVVMRRPKGSLVVISAPEVYKSPTADCYIVFGEAKVEDSNSSNNMSSLAALANASAGKSAMPSSGSGRSDGPSGLDLASLARDAGKKPARNAPVDDGPVDETGVDAKDIELVMQQVTCTRGQAVKALKDNGGDLINTIMSLS